MKLGKGRSAIVSGGCSGLGYAVARSIATTGAGVVLLDLPGDHGDPTAAQLGSNVRYAAGDVTDPPAIANAIATAESLGSLRVVVNCAGIAGPNPMVGPERDGPERFAEILQINVVGTFSVMQQAAAAMTAHADDDDEEERGVIVNTSSAAAFDGQSRETAYTASKGAVAAMTLPAARELAPHRIRVVAVAPGRFRTPLMEHFYEERLSAVVSDVPHPHRLGEPAEFAALVRHVIDNPMINGEVIRIDAALRMAFDASDR